MVGREKIKMASASTPSANGPVKDLFLVLTVQLKPKIKAHFYGRIVSSRGGGSSTASTAMAVLIFEANNNGCGILWVCFLMSMRSVLRGLIS